MKDRLRRRALTIPALVVALALFVITFPITAVIALLIDVGRLTVRRTPFMAIRILLFGAAYASLEIAGLVLLGGAWIRSGFGGNESRLQSDTFRVQMWWASSVLAAVKRVFGITLHAEGLDALPGGTPFVLIARHASIVDNLLPAYFVSRPLGIRLAYVMKAELEMDPCLDVAGNRLPNVFVRRGLGETDGEVAAIRRLGASLGQGEGVLIYPEGTRFDRSKLDGAVRRLANRSPHLHTIAKRYRMVLPPKPAGTLALLDATGGDAVVMAHRGLDGFARVADIWRGGMVHQTVHVLFWRIPRSSLPDQRGERVEWLYRVWDDIDRWVVDQVHPEEAPA